jgi:peroxiredoxin
MVATYSRARSYQDHGTVTTVFDQSGTRTTVRQSFESAFDRGGRYRFEFREDCDPKRLTVVWSDGTKTFRRWYGSPVTVDEEDLGVALEPPSYTIARFLLPNVVDGNSVGDATALRIEGQDTIDGRSYWRVAGIAPWGDPITMWIDQDTSLLHQLTTRHHFPARTSPSGSTLSRAFETETTTTYEAAIDTKIDPSQLAGPELNGEPHKFGETPWIAIRSDSERRISEVVPGGPASRAGLQVGDVIVSINNKPVASAADVASHIAGLKLGASVPFVVTRAGTQATIAVTAEQRPEASMLIGQPAPPFSLQPVNGVGSATLADLTGHVVLLDVWASWCKLCDATLPYLNDWQTRYERDGLRIVGLSSDDAEVIRAYARDHRLSYTQAQDRGGKVAASYLLEGMPMLVVIDKSGIVRHVATGIGDLDHIEPALVQLLK